jgi:hypothetical protein
MWEHNEVISSTLKSIYAHSAFLICGFGEDCAIMEGASEGCG